MGTTTLKVVAYHWTTNQDTNHELTPKRLLAILHTVEQSKVTFKVSEVSHYFQ